MKLAKTKYRRSYTLQKYQSDKLKGRKSKFWVNLPILNIQFYGMQNGHFII